MMCGSDTDSNIEIQLKRKLGQIASTLFSIETDDDSLMGGMPGVLLFCFYYSRYVDRSSLNIANKKFDSYISNFEKREVFDLSYANGIVGTLSFLHILQYDKHISHLKISNNDLDFIDNYYHSLVTTNCYEFLYGVAGVVTFLKLNFYLNPVWGKTHLERVVEKIETKLMQPLLKSHFNFGIAHGYSAWLIILSDLYKIGIKEKIICELIDRLLTYYLPYLSYDNSEEDCFPIEIHNKKTRRRSRMGWCNGDLSCLYSLLYCAETTNNYHIKNKALSKLKTLAMHRFDTERYRVYDAGMCHGAAGIAFIFYKIQQKYPSPEFKNATFFWNKCLLKHSCYDNGIAGFQKRYKSNDGIIIASNEYGLLEGISGIGLALIAMLYKGLGWESLLLL